MSAGKVKSGWILVVLILSGLVLGGLLGELTSQVDALWWMGYSQTFGISAPVQLDLSIIQLTFGMSLKINIASIIGMVAGICIYRMI